jgi:hypothetical protein
VLAAVLPAHSERARPRIDALGAGLLAAALSCIVVAASLGGNSWAWDSPQLIITAAAAPILLWVFGRVERGASEPVLPLRLFRNRTFVIACAIGLIVGFSLFGAVTFLPLFFQTVDGASPTGSGLRLLPLMAGVVLTSIGSGQLISRVGRYKPFPIAGTALLVIGFLLLAGVGADTSTLGTSWRLAVTGLGLGLVMQVLVIAVQNAVEYQDLGVATSGATVFALIGGSLGTAVFGAIFSNRLTSELAGTVRAGASRQGRLSPSHLHALPRAAHGVYVHAFTDSLATVFTVAAGIAAVGFLLALLLPDKRLRDTVAAAGTQEYFAMPRSAREPRSALGAALNVCDDDPPYLGAHVLPDLTEAAIRSGAEDAARSSVARLSERTLASRSDLAIGLLERSHALLIVGDEAEGHYVEALKRLGRTQAQPELGRTLALRRVVAAPAAPARRA